MKKYQLIEENQLMWCKVDTKGGAFGVTQKEHIGSLASTNMALAYIDREKYLPEFVSNLFRFKPFHENITKYSTGSTNRKYLTPNQLFEFIEIPDLSIDEQKDWINKLQLIQNSPLFEEIERQLALIKELRQAYLREAMQGKLVPQDSTDEPAEILLGKIKAEKEKLVHEKRIKRDKPLPPINAEEIPFEIPSNWAWCRLGEISNNVEYGTSEKGDLNSNDIAVLRMNNIQAGKVEIKNLKYVKATIEDLPKLYLKNNDLLFNRTNSCELVGKAGVFKGESDKITFASYLIRVQFSDLVSVDFANYYINSIQCRETQIEPDIIQQNGQANFNGTKLKNIIVPLPPLAEQERIVAKLEKLMKFCDELEANIKQGIKNADHLLQTALKEALEPK